MPANRTHAIACWVAACSGFLPMAVDQAWAYNYPIQVTASVGGQPGAMCDGGSANPTDDSDAIQRAINAAGVGGTVQFPAGKCYVSGYKNILVGNVTLVGAGSPHNSQESRGNLGEVGTTILIGLPGTKPGPKVPFQLGHSFTIRGINFEYPWTIYNVQGAPPADPALFSDDGEHGSGDALFEDVTVVAPYIFWQQSQGLHGLAPTYGNIKFTNMNVYATFEVFEWNNVQEQVVLDNWLSNPSICGGGTDTTCYTKLKDWTAVNGRWLHVVGTGSQAQGRPSVGMATSNTVITSYGIGVLIDSNGQLDESIFGPTTVWDGVPTILDIEPPTMMVGGGSITHTTFNGKSQNGRIDVLAPLFKIVHPQLPLDGALNKDANTLDLNGFSSEGSSREFLFLDASGDNDEFGSLDLSSAVIHNYCGGANSNAVFIAGKVDFVQIVGSHFNTSATACQAALNVSGGTYGKMITGNILYPSPPNPTPTNPSPN